MSNVRSAIATTEDLVSRSTRTPRRIRRALVAALAVASLSVVAATASADEFSTYTTKAGVPLVKTIKYPECSITVGPIFDSHPLPSGFHTIGGARVSCLHGGHTIGITVQQTYWNGYGPAVWTSASHVMISSWNMVQTPAYCSGGGFFWQTWAYVTIDGYGAWYNSPWSDRTPDAC
jgi:hypothetical protein